MADLNLTLTKALTGVESCIQTCREPGPDTNYNHEGTLLASVLRLILPSGTYEAMLVRLNSYECPQPTPEQPEPVPA